MRSNTVEELLEVAASASPNQVALTLENDSKSYGEIQRGSARLAHVLRQWGVRKGDRILYWSHISLRAIDLYFAVSRLGAVFVPANPGFSGAELDAILDYLEPAFIIADPAHLEEGAAAAQRADARFGVLGGTGLLAGLDLDNAASLASDKPPRAAATGRDANVFYLTSGSTGRPKAAVISHQAQMLRAASSQAYDAVCGGRGVACMFPLFHMAGWYMVLQAIGRRRPIHLTRQATADALWSIIDRHRPEELYCIPAVWRRILEDAKRRDGGCLAYALTGTSRVELDLMEEIRRHFPNARNGIYYGSTEMGVSLGIGHDDIWVHPYSVGTPMPNFEARIVDGELWLRAPTAMDGYFNLPAETGEVLRDDWYRSGDLVTVDDDGFYTIVGRHREIIRSGGEMIAPAEVEAAIVEMCGIKEVAVIGIPDEAWGEIVCAVVVAEPGTAPPTVDSVRSHLGGRLASFKHPRLVHITDEQLPRTGATGQVQRNQIRREILGWIADGAKP